MYTRTPMSKIYENNLFVEQWNEAEIVFLVSIITVRQGDDV